MSDLVIDTKLINTETISTPLASNVHTETITDAVNIVSGTDDYEKLTHLPSINGTKLIGNYDERDPTVSDWAKSGRKPTYTADEVGAIDIRNEISFKDIKELWDSVFTN
jgi:hypothetical protein